MVGIPAALRRVMLRKEAPPALKTSACLVRSAPPDSVRETRGNRLRSAISIARSALATVVGDCEPPFTVGSFALTMHSTPLITPIPVTRPAPRASSVPHPASGDNSRNGASVSKMSAIRSRGKNLPRARSRATVAAFFAGSAEPPPAARSACNSSTCARAARIAAAFAMNTGSFRFTWVGSTGAMNLTLMSS